MDAQDLADMINRRFDSVEASHKEHGDKLMDISTKVTKLSVSQENDQKVLDDHETRIRSNEQSKYRVGGAIAALSALVSSGVVTASNKLFGGE